jgi:L-lysine exporter family protein LysE/ArgO
MSIGPSLAAALAGLGFGLSLIVVIGAQNAFVLRTGALVTLRRHIGVVVAICTVSDVVLIAAGVAGAGAAIRSGHWVLPVVKVAGAVFLAGYAALALRRALRPGTVDDATAPAPRTSLAGLVLTTLALTWLNPGVYLDTVVLLGTVATSHGAQRWWFGGGAALGSALWFGVLGFGARLLAPVLARPGAWRVLDVFVAVVMLLTAARLVISV